MDRLIANEVCLITLISLCAIIIYGEANPCKSLDYGGCEHSCNWNNSLPTCSCYRGWELNGDHKTCRRVTAAIDEAFSSITVDRSKKPYKMMVEMTPPRPTASGEIDETNQLIQTGKVQFPDHRLFKFWYHTTEGKIYWDNVKGKTDNIWHGNYKGLRDGIVKLDFGQPGIHVQPGFWKIGSQDNNGAPFTRTFPCFHNTCTIDIEGHTQLRGNYRPILNRESSKFSNLLRSSFLRNSPGLMTITISGLLPSTFYVVKSYHHSTISPGGRFNLQYAGNKAYQLRQSSDGQRPKKFLQFNDTVRSNPNGRIQLKMRSDGNAEMNLNGMEIRYLFTSGLPIYFPHRRDVIKNKILTTLSKQGTVYVLRFQLYPLRFQSGWTNIIHFTAFGKNLNKYGDRNPGLWFHSASPSDTSNSLHICSAVNNNKNHCFNTKKIVPRGQWTDIEVTQIKEGSHHRYQIRINDQLLHSVTNRAAKTFSKVKVYVGDPWHNGAQGFVRGVVIVSDETQQVSKENTDQTWKYILIVFGIIGGIFMLNFIKNRMNNAPAPSPPTPQPANNVTPAPNPMHITVDDLSDVLKLDFGQPGVNVQEGFYKLGLPDGDGGTYTAKFTWFSQTSTITITGYTHTRGNYYTTTNSYATLSNLLRSSFLRNSPGMMKVEITNLKASTLYEIKTYHHSTSFARGGVEFTLKYESNEGKKLKQSPMGRNPDPPLIHTETVMSNAAGTILLTMDKGSYTGNAHMDLNGMEIRFLDGEERIPTSTVSDPNGPIYHLPVQDPSILSNTAAPPSYFSIFPDGNRGSHTNEAYETFKDDDATPPPSYFELS